MSQASQIAKRAHELVGVVGAWSAPERTAAIGACAAAIDRDRALILEANGRDMARAREASMALPLQDRLELTDARIDGLVSAMEEVAAQADPVGVVLDGRILPDGVHMERVSVPLGVVAMVYEARPNVTADAVALCLRSGNVCILRGGSAARESCRSIVDACRKGLESLGLEPDAVQLLDEEGHDATIELMHQTGLVDLLIPRGGAGLIRTCVQEATVPVVETGTGNCHIYLEKTADAAMAEAIVMNAKTSRPGVCNAAESLLVDRARAAEILPGILEALSSASVELVGDAEARTIAEACGVPMGEATDEDWGTEYLDLKMSVKVVEDSAEAIAHINRYGTGHSEAIVTEDYGASQAFLQGVDAAAVYVNASTRFTDGGMFGLGAEIGISTQKLHVRGPMGAAALTSSKYLLRGTGQVR